MSAALKVEFSIGSNYFDSPIVESLKEAIQRAMTKSAILVQQVWVGRAQQLNIRQTGAYIAGLTGEGSVEVIRPPSETFDGAILGSIAVKATAPHSHIVEDGHEAFHLPSRIDWSGGRVKMGKNGPYLHIPFRHGAHASEAQQVAKGYTRASVKAMMPQDIYKQAVRLPRTIKQNVGPLATPSGQFKAADAYKAGGRLKRGGVGIGFTAMGAGLVEERRGPRTVGHLRTPLTGKVALVNPAWKGSKFDGMIKSGPKRHSQYLTIRTITPTSPGWNIPAKEGTGIGRMVARETAPAVEEIVLAEVLGALGGS